MRMAIVDEQHVVADEHVIADGHARVGIEGKQNGGNPPYESY